MALQPCRHRQTHICICYWKHLSSGNRRPRQYICRNVSLAWLVHYIQVKLLELLDPASTARRQSRLLLNAYQRLMIGVHSTFHAMQVAPPTSCAQMYSEKLTVGNTVVALSAIQLPAEICNRPFVLHENCTYGNIRSVGFDYIVRLLWVR